MIVKTLKNLFSSDYRKNDIEERQLREMRLAENDELNSPETTATTSNVRVLVPECFKDDVGSLAAYIGKEHWKEGLTIELTLKELLSICPRERKRSDAYKRLREYLADEMKINLIIKKKGGQNAKRRVF